jgi:hypothetical protein
VHRRKVQRLPERVQVALNDRLERPAPHVGEEIVHSLRKRRGRVNPLVLGSSPSGPTNSRCSGTIGNDRRGTGSSANPRKNRDVGTELAYKLRSLTIAENRGHSDILGVTSGVTLGAQFELPRRMRLTLKMAAKPYFISFIWFSWMLIRFRTPNSNWQIAILVSSGELAIEGSCGRYRPRPVSDRLEFPAMKRPFAACGKLMRMLHKPCCDDMRRQVEFRCADHADLSDCPDSLVVSLENPARFGIRVHDDGSSYIAIRYCPWCGANLSAQPGVAQPR